MLRVKTLLKKIVEINLFWAWLFCKDWWTINSDSKLMLNGMFSVRGLKRPFTEAECDSSKFSPETSFERRAEYGSIHSQLQGLPHVSSIKYFITLLNQKLLLVNLTILFKSCH